MDGIKVTITTYPAPQRHHGSRDARLWMCWASLEGRVLASAAAGSRWLAKKSMFHELWKVEREQYIPPYQREIHG